MNTIHVPTACITHILKSVPVSGCRIVQNAGSHVAEQVYLTVKGYRLLFERDVRFEDRLCGLVVRVPGYTTEIYRASCEVRTEFIYVM
jgi:hypothetical protein